MEILLNFGYVLMLIALAVKDILFLRLILSSAQIIIIISALYFQNYVAVFWNTIFVILNFIQALLVALDRRPIKLTGDLKDMYESTFHIMTPKEFLQFWQIGKIYQISNKTLIKRNENQSKVMLVIEGHCVVRKGRKDIATLSRGNFIAEMSFLSGEPASADVIVKEEEDLKYISWNQKNLKEIKKINATLWNKILGIIGRDLVEKIKNTSSRFEN